MVLKEGGLLSLCTGVPLLSMVGVQMVLKEVGLLSLYVCISVPLLLMVRVLMVLKEGGLLSLYVLYRCAIWLVSMLAFMLVSVLRLLDSVPLSCTFLGVSRCVVASAL